MKNAGVILAISISLLTVSVGIFFLWKNGVKPPTQTSVVQEMPLQNPLPTDVVVSENPTEERVSSETMESDIDEELKNLDTEAEAAFQKDSETDPTTGIN